MLKTVCLAVLQSSSTATQLFEQACNERLQQFDDEAGDSDEDLWEEKELTFVPSKPSAALDTLVATASSAPSCC